MAFTLRSADVRHGYTARLFRVEQQRSTRVFQFRQLGAAARLSSLLFHLFAFSRTCEFIYTINAAFYYAKCNIYTVLKPVVNSVRWRFTSGAERAHTARVALGLRTLGALHFSLVVLFVAFAPTESERTLCCTRGLCSERRRDWRRCWRAAAAPIER